MRSKELDQFYTKQSVAIECIKELYTYIPMREYDIILEPSAGSGAFFYNLDKKKRIGIDIAPTVNDIDQMDFFDYTPPKGRIIVVGNPPFGVQSKLAVNFFNRAALFTDTIAFIVPITWQKWSIQRRLCEKFKLIYSKPLPPNSFTFNNEEYKVKCAFQIWTCRSNDIKYVDQRIRIKPKTTHLDFDFLPKSKRDEADFLFVVCGNRSQLVHETASHIAIQTTERIKAKYPFVKTIFENIDWSAHTNSNVGTMWINRETIVKEYEKYKQKYFTNKWTF